MYLSSDVCSSALQDKPYRHAGRARPVMHFVNPGDHVAIGRRLVYKAIARGIHDHRSRQRALENAKMRVLVGVYVTDRTPPGVVHKIETGANDTAKNGKGEGRDRVGQEGGI